MHDVIVIGAGVSGLTVARDLADLGRDVVVLEREGRAGGKIVSERFDGFLFEHGPTTLNAAHPAAEAIVRQLGLDKDRIDLDRGVRKRYLADKGRLVGIPIHSAGFFLSSYLSLRARALLMLEMFRPPSGGEGDESVFAFTSRRFGREFAEKVMDPMIGGIFMGNSRDLSVSAVFPKLVEFEHKYGSVTRGAIRSRRKGDPGRRLFSWLGGLETLTRSLASGLSSQLRCGVAVKRVTPVGGGFLVETDQGDLRARSVVLAVQPHVIAKMIENFDADGAVAAGGIAAPPAAVMFAGFRREAVAHPLDGLGYLSTRGSGVISGVQFPSTMFAGRAPDGFVGITAYVGGARAPELARLPASELASIVKSELAEMLGISADPVVIRLRHWPLGLPQYELGHEMRREMLRQTPNRTEGLYLTGNFLDGVSVGNCVASAREVAERVDYWLGQHAQTQYCAAI